jgi:serine/threonine protein kinase
LPDRSGDRDWAAETFTALLEALAYAHGQRRVVHRDLKPENVLIVNGVPMVSDFGLGKRLDASTTRLTLTNVGMGTLAYMAPEQFRDAAKVGTAADIYALGKMLGEMLCGKVPDVGRPRLEDFPTEFRGFIDKCTQDDPRDRYAGGTDALSAFQLLVTGGGATGEISRDLDTLLRLWEDKPLGDDDKEVREIAQKLLSRREDEEFYFKAVPRLPDGLVRQLVEDRPGDFDVILRAYNDHIQGDLPFDYCDVVASFYRQIFLMTDSEAQQKLILERLFELGPSHNRWHVGDVFADLLSGIEDQPAVEMAASIIRGDAYNARWYESYIEGVSLADELRAAFASQRPRPNGTSS